MANLLFTFRILKINYVIGIDDFMITIFFIDIFIALEMFIIGKNIFENPISNIRSSTMS